MYKTEKLAEGSTDDTFGGHQVEKLAGGATDDYYGGYLVEGSLCTE